MKEFEQILRSLLLSPKSRKVVIDHPPSMTCCYNPRGGRYSESLVVELDNNPLHLTIYQSTWDGEGMDPEYGEAPLGPHGLHLTTRREGHVSHVFFKVEEDGSAWCLSDDNWDGRAIKAINMFLDKLWPHMR